jgi:D-alanine transaminase
VPGVSRAPGAAPKLVGMSRIAYVNGAFVPEAEATVSIFDRGFVFGDGVYEVVAMVDGHFVDGEGHLDRLERSLGEIQLAMPMPRAELARVLAELAARNGVTEGLIYWQVTRGVAERDFAFPAADTTPTIVAWTRPTALIEHPKASTGTTAITVPDLRWKRRDIKSISLLAQVLAKQQARAAGVFEAFMIEDDGYLTEGGSSTTFIVKDGTLITTPLGHEILPGITRARTFALAKARGMAIVERRIQRDELLAADEVFLTAATAFVLPIVVIDGTTIGSGAVGAVSAQLRADYVAYAKAGAS